MGTAHSRVRRSPGKSSTRMESRTPSTKWLTISGFRSILNHMVEDMAELDGVFHALANGARREMLGRLKQTHFGIFPAAVYNDVEGEGGDEDAGEGEDDDRETHDLPGYREWGVGNRE